MEKLPVEIHEMISDYLEPVEHLNYLEFVKTFNASAEWHYSGLAIDCTRAFKNELSCYTSLSPTIILLLKNTGRIDRMKLCDM